MGWVLLNFLAIKYIIFLGLGFLGLVLLNILVVQDREAWIKEFLGSTFGLLVVLGFVAYGGIAVGSALFCVFKLITHGFNWGTLLLLFAVPALAIFIPSLFLDTTEKSSLTWKHLLVGFWGSFLLIGMYLIILIPFGLFLFWAVDCILKLLPPIGFWGNVLVFIAVLFGMLRLTLFIVFRFCWFKKKDTTEKLPFSPLHFLHPTSGLLTQNKDTTEE
ncbi:MAG: hypothetical protein HEQ32_00420 [Vampirovibrio sp.]